MARLEDLKPNASVRGFCLMARHCCEHQWHGSAAIELTLPKTPEGKVANQLCTRHDEPRIEVVEEGRPWSFDGDGGLFRLVSEAQRIRLAIYSIQCLAVHTSIVEPLPHQIYGRLRGNAASPTTTVFARRRSGCRQDNYGRPSDKRTDRAR